MSVDFRDVIFKPLDAYGIYRWGGVKPTFGFINPTFGFLLIPHLVHLKSARATMGVPLSVDLDEVHDDVDAVTFLLTRSLDTYVVPHESVTLS